LQVKRRYPDHTTWEPRIGAFASIQRALGARGKSFALARANEVAAQVTPLEAGFCHVRLMGSVRGQRAQRLWGAVALTAFGAALAGVVPILGAIAPWSLLLPAAAWAAAIAVARRHRHENERVHVGLEQVLDRLERGEIRGDKQIAGPRTNAFVRIADEIRKTVEIIWARPLPTSSGLGCWGAASWAAASRRSPPRRGTRPSCATCRRRSGRRRAAA